MRELSEILWLLSPSSHGYHKSLPPQLALIHSHHTSIDLAEDVNMFVCLITLTLLCSKQTWGSKTSRVSKQKANGGKDETVRMLLNWELWSLWFCIKYLTCVIYAPFEHCFRGSSAHYRGCGSSVPWGCGNTHSIPAICLQGFSVFWLSKEANVGRLWGGMNSRCKVCENLGYVWASCQDFEVGGGGDVSWKSFIFQRACHNLLCTGAWRDMDWEWEGQGTELGEWQKWFPLNEQKRLRSSTLDTETLQVRKRDTSRKESRRIEMPYVYQRNRNGTEMSISTNQINKSESIFHFEEETVDNFNPIASSWKCNILSSLGHEAKFASTAWVDVPILSTFVLCVFKQ